MGARFSCFLVKIASRCNLACDYCYVYEHADQTWRDLPRTMDEAISDRFVSRLSEYVTEHSIEEVVVIFHGGEPLLAGPATIARIAEKVRAALLPMTVVSFSMQTNGVLLTDAALDVLESARIGVSLSLDGPRDANDRHRLTIRGRSSFDATLSALERLKTRPNLFAGVISVIDPAVDGRKLLEFFHSHRPPRIDLLLPDANHLRPPPGRDKTPHLYVTWLIKTFDAWFDDFADLPVRTFDAILAVAVGLPSATDTFGFGDVTLLSIETDGSYHDLDVLKITENGATSLGHSLHSAAIADVADHERVVAHRFLLTFDGLSEACRACPEVTSCGGGAVPHRFGANGFDNPTVYCGEMLSLISHARMRLLKSLPTKGDLQDERSSDSLPQGFVDGLPRSPLGQMVTEWQDESAALFTSRHPVLKPDASDRELFRRAVTRPGIVLRTTVEGAALRGRKMRSLGGRELLPDPDFEATLSAALRRPNGWTIHGDDPWLRAPFDYPIEFESDPDLVSRARTRLSEARDLIGRYSPIVDAEIDLLCHDVQFVRDLEAEPDKYVSFSDDILPGAVFVSVRGEDAGLIGVVDLADSLIHEYRHQKLYLLERTHRLFETTDILVSSPWRQDLRPPSGVLHAVYVFVELLSFWRFVLENEIVDTWRAAREVDLTIARLATAFDTLAATPLSAAGEALVRELRRVSGV